MTAQLLATILVYAALGAGADARPAIHVSPTKALAGSYQHFEFTFTVGSRGMGQGGGVRIELPVAYLETGPYYWDRPQTDSTAGRGYVRAISTGNAAVDINLAGRNGGIVECVVRHGSMKPGERIALEYSGVVQSIAWKLPVRAEWRMDAQGAWQAVDNAPIISFLPQKAVTVFAVTPADIQHGAEFDLAVVLLDRYGNRATGYAGTVSFASTDVDAKLLRPYTFTVKDAGVRVFPGVQYESTGFHKVTLTDGHLAGRSNYSEVHASPPMLRRCFGDTHFHTGSGTDNSSFSTTSAGGDHRGHYTTQDSAYAYARDVMRLDFASAAEHDAKVFTGSLWEKAQAITDSFHEPDRFTTFYAYEWTASPTEGHHVILYRDRAGQVLDHFEYPTKTALYDGLRRQGVPAVMIPHAMWA
ncbi:MAG: DUF3604 domain-containing protein, partial [bacterium]|nr:DUF3604 domain-containing protein [bacterium]